MSTSSAKKHWYEESPPVYQVHMEQLTPSEYRRAWRHYAAALLATEFDSEHSATEWLLSAKGEEYLPKLSKVVTSLIHYETMSVRSHHDRILRDRARPEASVTDDEEAFFL